VEQVNLPEGSKVLVTLLPDEQAGFWLGATKLHSMEFGLTPRMMCMPSSSIAPWSSSVEFLTWRFRLIALRQTMSLNVSRIN
jgi:hypothetical protein